MLFPVDVSAHGYWVDRLFYLTLWLTGGAFVIVLGVMGYFLVRYRERPGRRAYYTHGESRGAKLLTGSIEVAVFFLVYVNLAYNDNFAWKALWGAAPDPATALQVGVWAERFTWSFKYPGADGQLDTSDDLEVFELHVPAGQPVSLSLRSKDVIHSFFLPNARVKMDVVPGMTTRMHFVAKRSGTYDIACAELCGAQHYQMGGKLIVESPDAFQSWLTQETKGGWE